MTSVVADQKNGSIVDEDDDDLDALLDDALNDFETKPKPDHDEKPPTAANVGNTISGEKTHPEPPGAHINDDLTEMLEKMVMNEPSLKEHFETFQQKMESSNNTGSVGAPTDFDLDDENIGKAFEEFTKNFPGLSDEDTGGGGDFEEMLKQMQSELEGAATGAGVGAGVGDEEGVDGFMGMMQGMMQNLLSKDLLYPSLKEIKDKYPDWFERNKSKVPSEEYEKYKKQEAIVCRLCELFESEREGEDERVKSERTMNIVSLMEEMQTYGHPPADMMENIVCGENSESQGTPTAPPAPECSIM